MQDIRTKEVPHRLHACPKGLAHHRVEREGLCAKVRDLEPRTFARDAGVWFPQYNMIAGNQVAESRGKSRQQRILPATSCGLCPFLPGCAIKAEGIEWEMGTEVLQANCLIP
jgi:hypothetical protein